MKQHSYDNTKTLFLIPTPIGNMQDITYRAIETLKNVEVVFAEDTRVTKELFNYFKIDKKLIANNEHKEEQNIKRVLKYLEDGFDVGLVSDRGTPVISDPGYRIVKGVIDGGYNVVALPGATALIPALITSGIEPNNFTFIGFLNKKNSARKKQLEELKTHKETLILYESPHQIIDTLHLIKEIMGERYVSISREISKKFEEVIRGNISTVILELDIVKGEFVIVLEGNKETITYSDEEILKSVNDYIKQGLSVSDSIKEVASKYSMNKRYVYNIYHKEGL